MRHASIHFNCLATVRAIHSIHCMFRLMNGSVKYLLRLRGMLRLLKGDSIYAILCCGKMWLSLNSRYSIGERCEFVLEKAVHQPKCGGHIIWQAILVRELRRSSFYVSFLSEGDVSHCRMICPIRELLPSTDTVKTIVVHRS